MTLKSVSIVFHPLLNAPTQILTVPFSMESERLETEIIEGWFTVRKYNGKQRVIEYSYPQSSVLFVTEEHFKE